MFGKNPISVIILKHASVLDPKTLVSQPLDVCKSLFQRLLFIYSCSFKNFMLITSWSSPLWIFIFLLYQLKRNKNKLWILSERAWLFRWFLCQGNKYVQLQNYFICFLACAGMIKQQWKRGLVWTTKFLILTCTKYQLPLVNWSLTIRKVSLLPLSFSNRKSLSKSVRCFWQRYQEFLREKESIRKQNAQNAQLAIIDREIEEVNDSIAESIKIRESFHA